MSAVNLAPLLVSPVRLQLQGEDVQKINPLPTYDTASAAPTFSAAVDVTAGDVALPAGTRSIFVGTGGDVSAALSGDTGPMVYKNVANGTVLAGQFVTVTKVGTTAADMIARG